MLSESLEADASVVANASEEGVAGVLQQLSERDKIEWSGGNPTIIIGRDTRQSSPRFVELITAAATALQCKVVDYGLLTTPQCHWLVHRYNNFGAKAATVEAYYQTLSSAFLKLIGDHKCSGSVRVDCANGVGLHSISGLQKLIPSNKLKIETFNDGTGVLNKDCGADYVQSKRLAPLNVDTKVNTAAGVRLCSLDGDADRIVYHYVDHKHGGFQLLDGDKIIALFALYLTSLLEEAGLAAPKSPASAPAAAASSSVLTLGIVQTAYANGASTNYMCQQLGKKRDVDLRCANTGIKHLHRLATQHFDIGIYFEANGHGTIHFSDHCYQTIRNKKMKEEKTLTAQQSDGMRVCVCW